ncbi:MAG: hypothetical protein HY684_03295 [Chloroflexi bacterium]|nr:hypothetical protein [Chloroflexota bacterium]
MLTHRWTRRFSSRAYDLVALALLAVLYSLPVLTRPADVLPLDADLDHEVAPYVFVRESLLDLRFPIWNSYYGTGQPLLADPIASYLYPLSLAPVLAFGVIPGVKVALVLSVFLSGMGQWLLGRAVNLPRSLCLWAAALFMLSGHLANKFSDGHYAYILSYPWVPFSLAFTLLALRHRRPLWIALAALGMAMPVLAGNSQYFLFVLIAGLVAALARGAFAGFEARSWQPALATVALYAGIVALAVGLASVRLLPALVDVLPTMVKYPFQSEGSLSPYTALSFILRHLPSWEGKPTNWEWYSFLGPVPFLGLVFLYTAWRQREARQHVVIFGALGLVSLLVIAQAYPYSPFYWLGQVWPLWNALRNPMRALILTTCALITLGAIGFAYWRAQGWRAYLKTGVLAAGVLMVFLINGYVLYASGPSPTAEGGLPSRHEARPAIAWLRQHDSGVFYVQAYEQAPGEGQKLPPAHYDLLNARIKILDAYYGWYPTVSPAIWKIPAPGLRGLASDPPPLKLQARYMLVPAGQSRAFAAQGYRLAATVDGWDVIETDAALPYAFVLPPGASPEARSVRPAEVDALKPGRVLVTAVAEPGDRVIALETFYPGWTVEVDGRPGGEAVNYRGVMSAQALPGEHQYTFDYKPASARWGLALSLAAAGVLLGLLVASRRSRAPSP